MPSPKPRFSIASSLRRHEPVLAARVELDLRAQDLERADEARPRLVRLDDFVDLAEVRGAVGVEERLAVLLHDLALDGDGIARRLDLFAAEDADRTVGAHHRDLRCRP